MQTTRGITNPLNLDITDATGYLTGQDYIDQAHVDEIADDMRTHGWRGAPLVVLPDYATAYSGTHRLAAAQAAELDEIPAVTLHALFAARGLDLNAICDEENLGLLTDRPEILRHLDDATLTAYALDDIY